jgi:hypothetical protein
MQKIKNWLILLFILFGLFYRQGFAQNAAVGFSIGHNGGLSFKIHGILSNFAQGFPLAFKLGIGYTPVDPGNAADARRIFINDATNGTPEKSGSVWDFRGDLLYRMKWFPPAHSFIYAGIRYATFSSDFKFVGGNEDFEVTSDHWGIGTGLEIHFPINKRLDLISTAGIDYYLNSELKGHDTVYSPDGENINPRNEYSYTDADKAINQPKIEFLLMIGLNFHLK